MKVMGILGSPRLRGKCAKLLDSALEGAAGKGAETVRVDLIKKNIKYCMGCGTCFLKNPELAVGKCPLKDDCHAVFEEYFSCDAYFYASPTYDMFCTALMKTFLERKIAFTYRDTSAVGLMPEPRPGITQYFKKKASFIVTANVADELEEVMGEPCYEAFEAHLLFEQIDTLDKLFVGGVENITESAFNEKLAKAYEIGGHLVEAVTAARKDG